ncbi:MAG: hypothetical protein AAF696_37730, partial [Bacteroidota bacterium]
PVAVCGQGSDFIMGELHQVTGTRIVEPERRFPINSGVQVYSDGRYLSVAIKVKDAVVNDDPDPAYADRVDVWLALPEYSFPKNYPFAFHPRLLSAPAIRSRSYEELPKRLFSIDESYASRLNKRNFLNNYDYPEDMEIRDRNLNLPYAREIEESLFPFAIAQFSFFRDGRAAIWANEYVLGNVEEQLGMRFSPLTDGVRYTADPTENGDGYIINIEFSIEAFGFVSLPNMEGVNLMVDVLNAPSGQRARVVNSTSSMRSIQPLSFEYIRFKNPIKTNYTELSDEIFEENDFYPLMWYSENDWQGFGIDVDALVLDRSGLSQDLLEIKLYEQELEFKNFSYSGYEIDLIQAEMNYVNRLPEEKELIRANGQNIVAERVRVVDDRPKSEIEDRWFTFGDGTLGLIYQESIPHHRFGWGKCGDCLFETIHIKRISEAAAWDILEIEQKEGDQAYCKIETLEYENFYVSNFDWVEEGSRLVLRLRHRFSKEKKRVEVSWDEYGTDLEVEELE